MTEVGVVAVVEQKQTTTDIVNEAVGAKYAPAYVAAMAQLLPPEFRNPVDLIALGIRAKKSGLDPFTEIHAWKNERGKLQFQIARDGFIYIAENDPNVESLEFQHVYEGETFEWEKQQDGKILVSHTGGLVKGALLGAYCIAHMKEDRADHMEMRVVENYRHLMKKANWQYLPEMLITRVIGACVRLVCPDRAGGLYSEADNELAEVASVNDQVRVQVQTATVEKIEDLASTIHDPIVINAEPVIEDRHQCGVCGKAFKSQQGLAGHMRAHKKEDPTPSGSADPSPPPSTDPPPEKQSATPSDEPSTENGKGSADTSGEDELVPPEGYLIHQNGALYEITDPNAVVVEGKYYTWNDAVLAAQNDQYARSVVAEGAPTEVKLADIYAWCRLHSVHATVVGEIVNDHIYADEFEQFRREGAEKIDSFNLDSDARRTLLELVQQKHGTV